MKTIIISPCFLPVPAVKGGAVLTLIESLIIQNEIEKMTELTIVSSYDKEAEKKSKKYKHTNFIFIKDKKPIEIIDRAIEYIRKNILKKNGPSKRYLRKIYIIKKIKEILHNENYDKVVFENSGFLLKSIKNKKLLEKYKNKVYYHLHNDIPKNVDKKVIKECKLILISKYLEKNIINLLGSNFIKKCQVVKNGFDCSKFNKEVNINEINNIKQKLKISNEKKIILYTGRIIKEKGIEELINAICSLNDNKLFLLIVGSFNFGSNETSLFEKRMNDKVKQLKDNIAFTGFVPYDKMYNYYNVADIAVLPSVWQEPAGLTMLEATAAKVPLITTNSGGIPEYLNKDLVNMIEINQDLQENIKSQIINILNNYEKYKKKAIKASNFVADNYNEKKFYNDFIDCILDF